LDNKVLDIIDARCNQEGVYMLQCHISSSTLNALWHMYVLLPWFIFSLKVAF